jgi:hypothetical protein
MIGSLSSSRAFTVFAALLRPVVVVFEGGLLGGSEASVFPRFTRGFLAVDFFGGGGGREGGTLVAVDLVVVAAFALVVLDVVGGTAGCVFVLVDDLVALGLSDIVIVEKKDKISLTPEA